MENFEVLLDTNVIRRLMENNTSMTKVIEDMRADGYSFAISDMSLFELLTSKDVSENLNKFLSILYDYKIIPVYKSILPNFDKQYFDWFKEPKSIEEMKNNIFPSFVFTLSTFLSDFTNAIILFLANKLTSDYSSEFYLHILNIIDTKSTKTHFERVLNDCYILNKEKLRKRIPEELKNLILREFTYFNLLQRKSHFYKEEFIKEFEIQQKRYLDKSFKEICSSFLSETDIKVRSDETMNKLDEKFITNYFKNILCTNGKFNINDITDYINFKYGMVYCYSYYTTDDKSLKKYADYFQEQEVVEFLNKVENILNKYKFTS